MTADDRDELRAHRLLMDACIANNVPFLWQGPGTLLISGAGALAVINSVESSGERVIGLEGFDVESPIVHPRLDLIYDESIAPRGGAAAVASEWGDGVWLDVTLAANARGSGDGA